MNKDVLLTIYEILHRDLTKQLNAEYLKKLAYTNTGELGCGCECEYYICGCFIAIQFDGYNVVPLAYNYRSTIGKWMSVYTKYGKKRCHVSINY